MDGIDALPPQRGDIFFIDLTVGAVGSEQKGDRPAVVISNNLTNQFNVVVVVAAITTTVPAVKNQPWNVKLTAGNPLPRESYIMCTQLRTVDKSRFRRKAGSLSPVQMAELETALKSALGIDGTL